MKFLPIMSSCASLATAESPMWLSPENRLIALGEDASQEVRIVAHPEDGLHDMTGKVIIRPRVGDTRPAFAISSDTGDQKCYRSRCKQNQYRRTRNPYKPCCATDPEEATCGSVSGEKLYPIRKPIGCNASNDFGEYDCCAKPYAQELMCDNSKCSDPNSECCGSEASCSDGYIPIRTNLKCKNSDQKTAFMCCKASPFVVTPKKSAIPWPTEFALSTDLTKYECNTMEDTSQCRRWHYGRYRSNCCAFRSDMDPRHVPRCSDGLFPIRIPERCPDLGGHEYGAYRCCKNTYDKMTIVDENKCVTNGNSCCVGHDETPRCSDGYTPVVTRNACRWDSPISGKWSAYRCVKEYDPNAPLQHQNSETTTTPPPGWESVSGSTGWVPSQDLTAAPLEVMDPEYLEGLMSGFGPGATTDF